jgi:NADH dehydrogenase FAD-containing subunit
MMKKEKLAILDATSLELERTAFKKASSALKKKKIELSQNNMVAKVEVAIVKKKKKGKYSKPIWQGLERIFAKDWNVKWAS